MESLSHQSEFYETSILTVSFSLCKNLASIYTSDFSLMGICHTYVQVKKWSQSHCLLSTGFDDHFFTSVRGLSCTLVPLLLTESPRGRNSTLMFLQFYLSMIILFKKLFVTSYHLCTVYYIQDEIHFTLIPEQR